MAGIGCYGGKRENDGLLAGNRVAAIIANSPLAWILLVLVTVKMMVKLTRLGRREDIREIGFWASQRPDWVTLEDSSDDPPIARRKEKSRIQGGSRNRSCVLLKTQTDRQTTVQYELVHPQSTHTHTTHNPRTGSGATRHRDAGPAWTVS